MKTRLELENERLRKRLLRFKKALENIASASQIRHEMRDYANIGKNAILTAKEALHNPCTKCGK